MRRVFCFAIVLALPLGALGAQETPVVTAGTRVRVTAPHGRRVVGNLATVDSATIVLQRANGTTVTFPRERGTRLDVSQGRGACSGARGNCVAIGFLGGAALGALAGFVSVQSHGGANSPDCADNGVPCTLVFLFAVPAGAVVGTVVGAVVGGEHWSRADLPARLSLGPDASGRFAVGLSLHF